MKSIYLYLLDIKAASSPVVLATVTDAAGSTPGKPGNTAIFGKSGLIAGTTGGGATEGKAGDIAQSALLSNKSGLFHFNLDNDPSDAEHPICGGRLSILMDSSPQRHTRVFEMARQSLLKRIPGVLITVADGNEDDLALSRFWITSAEEKSLPPRLNEKLKNEISNLLSSASPGDFRMIDLSGHDMKEKHIFFLEALFPQPHLVIAGAGHIGKALATLGKFLDFEVTVIDDRAEYANPVNIPDADNFINDEIGRAIENIRKTSDTYVVIVTRGHKDDANALRPCIGKHLAYVGMIGSKRKVELMRDNFILNGWATPHQWDRIYSPVGIDIKSKTVAEIAVSIAAQLVLVRNDKKSGNE